MTQEQITHFDGIFNALCTSLDITESQFDTVVRSYRAVGDWLAKSDSSLAPYKPLIRPQGSFLLGTMVRPINENDDLDIDLVCELTGKHPSWDQYALKHKVGGRLKDNDTYKKMLEDASPLEVCALVNAAGFGKFGKFEDIPLDEQMNMIDLNCKALMAITHVTLPYMPEGSRVYQLGSLSAFQPVPYIATYGATKSFVLSFSRALNKELEKRKIRMIAICPGWVKTEFFNRAVTDDTIKYYNKFYTSKEVVTRAIYDMYRGKDVSVCGASTRAQVFLTKLLPHKLVMKIWCKQQKK